MTTITDAAPTTNKDFISIERERVANAFSKIDDNSIEMIFNRLAETQTEELRDGYSLYGCGGIGSEFAYALPNRFVRGKYMAFGDPDIIEEKNIERQRYRRGHIGSRKAEVTMSIFGDSFIRQGNHPVNVTEIKYPNKVMQDWDTFMIKTSTGLLFTDSMQSRLGLALLTRHSRYIHAANNSTTSFAISVNATNKLEFLGYLIYLLVHLVEQELEAPAEAASCADASAVEQTDIANASAAFTAIELLCSDSPYSNGAILQRIGYEKLCLTKEETSAMLTGLGLLAKPALESIYMQKAQQKLNTFLSIA